MKIIVIGESCKDVFVYGNCNRLSPEAPVPVMIPIDVKENLGMSGNVVKNIQALDSKVNIIHWHQKESITKKRYVEKKSNHMFLRVDEGEENITPFELNISKTNAIRNVDGVIISDYDKGFLSELVRQERLSIVEEFKVETPKTKQLVDKIKDMGGTPIKLDEVNYLLFSEHELLMVIKTKVD